MDHHKAEQHIHYGNLRRTKKGVQSLIEEYLMAINPLNLRLEMDIQIHEIKKTPRQT